MPKYSYLAKNLSGEIKKGTIEAENEVEAAQILKNQGLFLIKLSPEIQGTKKRFVLFHRKISLVEKIFFTRNLQVMIGAGTPLTKALDVLALQTNNQRFKKIISELRDEIIRGKTLSQALSKFPETFSDFYVNLVKVGEETGKLEEVLGEITFQMERENELKKKIQGALIYPTVIVIFMILIGFVMLVTVVPKIATFFKEFNAQLPLSTKIVIFLGDFLKKNLLILILSFFGFLIFLRFLLKIQEVKKFLDHLFLKIPIISPLFQKLNTAYFSRSLSTLLKGGVSLPKALEISGKTLSNFYFKKAVLESIEKVQKGTKLSRALSEYSNLFPPVLVQMLEVGEETGETSEILEKIANFYEEEVSRTTQNLVSLIEPLLMILIGGVVGFFAVSMVQPMYSLMQSIK